MKNRKQYKQYMKSDNWKSKRSQRIFKDGGMCQGVRAGKKCLSRFKLEVHHKTYIRMGNELMDDLITLCHKCHLAIHKRAA